jgi:hypothetical protein
MSQNVRELVPSETWRLPSSGFGAGACYVVRRRAYATRTASSKWLIGHVRCVSPLVPMNLRRPLPPAPLTCATSAPPNIYLPRLLYRAAQIPKSPCISSPLLHFLGCDQRQATSTILPPLRLLSGTNPFVNVLILIHDPLHRKTLRTRLPKAGSTSPNTRTGISRLRCSGAAWVRSEDGRQTIPRTSTQPRCGKVDCEREMWSLERLRLAAGACQDERRACATLGWPELQLQRTWTDTFDVEPCSGDHAGAAAANSSHTLSSAL